jgi:PAS domain S-box-containing protein
MENCSKKERQSLSVLIVIFIIFSAGIITVGYLNYKSYKKHYRTKVEQQLSAIGRLKADELANWRQDRLGDAAIFYKNAAFSALVRRYFEKPDNMDAQGQIRTWLSQIQAAYKYDVLILLDTQYSKKIIVPDGPERITSFVSQSESDILRSGKVVFGDFYQNEQNQRIYLKILVPILDEANDNRPIGILALRIDPDKYLYPFINKWPTPSRTAETLLIRREGNEVRFLNELKFQKNTALNLRVPLDEKKELPAVKAAQGHEGIVDGIDYRGIPVIADVRAVPDSPWFLVTRMDTSEVYAPLKERLWETIVLVGILLTGASAVVGFIWKQQSARFYQQKYEAAEALRESQERYRALVENTVLGITVIDTNYKIITANTMLAKLFNKPASDFVGKNCFREYEKREAVCPHCPGVRAVASGKTTEVETQGVRDDGSRFYVRNHAIPFFGPDGVVKGFIEIVEDITERKKTEQMQAQLLDEVENANRKLKKYQSNLEELVEERTEQFTTRKELLSVTLSSMGDGVIAVDVKKRIMFFNTVAENLAGWKSVEVQGKPLDEIFQFINGVTKKTVESPLDRALVSGKTEAGTDFDAFITRDGKERPISATAAPIRKNDGIMIGIVMVFRDVSHEREIDRMKTDFVSSVSHELRTPLTSIKAYTATILRDPGMSEETRREFLAIINDESNRLANLIEDLLEVSRIESGTVEIVSVPVDIAAVTEQVIPVLQPLADKKNIRLEMDIGDELPEFHGDESKIQSVITNLVNNAIKFTLDQGRVSVSVQHQGEELAIRVSDTGMGIPKECLSKIFDRFYRVHRPGKQIQGTGLGLAIVKKIVMMHHGRIEVESEVDQGTSFTVFLPLAAKSLAKVLPA